MNRFQKKCLVASSALHGLLVVAAIFGAALTPKPEPAALQHFTLVGLPTDLQSEAPVAEATRVPAAAVQAETPTPRPVLSPNELQRVSRNSPAPNPTSNRRPANDTVKNAVAEAVRSVKGGTSASG